MPRSLLVLLLFASGLAAECLLLREGLDLGPFARTPVGVEARIWDGSRRIRTEGWTLASSGLVPSPAYTLCLSSLAFDGTGAVPRARAISIVLLIPALASLMLVLLWRRAGPWAAAAASLALGFCAPVLLAAGSLAPDIPAVLFLLAALAVLGSSPGIAAWALAGVLLGVGTCLEPILATSLTACLLVMSLYWRGLSRRAAGAVALLGGWAAVLLVTGFVAGLGPAFPGNLGIEIYRGHRVGASGVEPRRGDRDAERWWGSLDYIRELSRQENRRVSLQEAGAHWASQAALAAVKHPLREIQRTGVKAVATMQGEPLPGEVSTAFLIQTAENPALLRIAVWIARVLVPLGLVSLWLSRRRGCVPLLALAASGLLAAWITYANPGGQVLVTVAAVGGIAFFPVPGGHGRRMTPGRWGGAAGAACLLFILPLVGIVPGSGIQGEDHFQLGVLFDREGRGSAAIREYERALRLDPMNPYPRFSIAGLLVRDNMNQEAIKELERVREDHPDFGPALLGLTKLYQAERQFVEAAAVYAELMRIEPWNPEHLNNLGTMYVQIGYFDQAVRALEAALEVSPDFEIARGNLESLRKRGFAAALPAEADSLRRAQETILGFVRAGDMRAADSTLSSAYDVFGRTSPELRFLDGTIRLVQGDAPAAVPLLEASLEGLGPTIPVLANLGTAYLQVGRYVDAKTTFQEALRLQPANLNVQRSLALVETALDSLARSGSR